MSTKKLHRSQAHGADKPLELLLGKDGAFVRGIVLDELAKGIDAALRLSTDGAVGRARSRLASIFRVSITIHISRCSMSERSVSVRHRARLL